MADDLLRECLDLVDRLRELRAPRDIEEGALMLNTCDYYALDDLAAALRARLAEPRGYANRNGTSASEEPSAPAPAPSEGTLCTCFHGHRNDLPFDSRRFAPDALASCPVHRHQAERRDHRAAPVVTDEEISRELAKGYAREDNLRVLARHREAAGRHVAAVRAAEARARKEGT